MPNIDRIPRAAFTVGALLAAAVICAGCAVPAATILPSVLGVSPVVIDNLGAGKFDSFWIVRYDDVVQATLRAGKRLSLTLKEADVGEDTAKLRYADNRELELGIVIERRSETVTRGRFDIGSNEYLGFARLFAQQLVDELNDTNAFLVDWPANRRANPR